MNDHFVQTHSMHIFPENDNYDYSSRDKYFIQCLKAMENIMDLDAYIIDYKNKNILYATPGGTLHLNKNQQITRPYDLTYLDKFILPKEMPMISYINYKVYDFFYSLPAQRRLKGYFTHDFKIQGKGNKTILINQKVTILDLTNDGVLRLSLCVISYPSTDKSDSAYIKMTDTNTVYEFIHSTQRFVEVKTQKLTLRATAVLKLASNGKTEAQIAKELGISLDTVKYHKKRIFAQLGVKNIAEAIQWMNNQKKLVKR